MTLLSKRTLELLSVGIVAAATTMAAQSTRGAIAGVVTDPSGAVVPNATVSVAPENGGEARDVTTGQNGEYRVEALNPGPYTVTVKAQGFADKKVEHVGVRTSQITSGNIGLTVGNTSEVVEVQAGANQIQTETGELSETVPTQDVRDLPYVSLNAYQLATTLPGVAKVSGRDDFTNGTSFAVNGLRPRSNNFLIDGFDNNDNGIGGQAFQPNNTEAIQEVTVLTNSYQAEYGRGGASVSNITFRSGSNNFHGAAWEQYSGAGLNALTSEDARSGNTRPPNVVNNIFGFRVGGPALKDKLFFFGTAQWNRNYGAQPTASPLQLPTAAGIATLSTQSGNPNVDMYLSQLGGLQAASGNQLVPIGARPGCPAPCNVEFGTFTRNDKGASLSREWTGRVDFNPSSSDSFYVRYTDSQSTLTPDLFANTLALPSEDTQQGGPSRVLGTLWAHTFSPRVLNEFRFSAQQINFAFAPTAATLASPFANLPTFTFANTGQFFGGFAQGTFPQGRGHKVFQFQDAVSFTKASHSFKMGTDLAILSLNDEIPFNANGLVNINPGGDCTAIGITDPQGCSDLANFIDGFTGPGSSAVSKAFGTGRIATPTNQQAYYFQDSWKMKPNFTLDYGLRYEYQPPDASNVLPFPAIDVVNFGNQPLATRVEQRPDRNNFAPRVGFAYTPHFLSSLFGENRTVIRGGYGIFYDAFFTNISNNTAATSPNSATFSQDAPSGTRGIQDPAAVINSATAAPSPFGLREMVASNLVNPMIHQWNLNVQRELPGRFVAQVAYVGTRAERNWVNQQLNPRIFDPVSGSDDRLFPQFGSTIIRTNKGDSVYHGLQTELTRNIGWLSLRASYTYSKSLDNQSEVFATSGGASRWQNVFDPRSDRGPSAFDRTHVASISYVLQLPSLRNSNTFLREVFGGWETSGIIGFQSGSPETVYLGGFDQNGDGEFFNDRPFLGNPRAAINYSQSCINDPTCITGVGFDDGSGSLVDFNTGAPGTADQFRYIASGVTGVNGNVTRNNIRYPGQATFDMSVMKRFAMPWEGHAIELRLDAFNAFNHPNLGIVSNSNFGNILDTANFLNLENTRRGGRTVALWAKYQF